MLIATRLIPPLAILEAIEPDANTIDNEFPTNFHFLKRLTAAVCKPNTSYDMNGNRLLVP